MTKEIKLLTAISDEIHAVSGLIISETTDFTLSIAVKTLDDAFRMSYIYRTCKATKIEKLKNNYPENYNYLVVVYK